MPQATLSATLSFLPPGVAAACQAAMSVVSNYTSMEGGTLDIPDATVSGTVFALPFGSVNQDARAFVFKNTNNQDMWLRLNGSSNLYRVPPNGSIFIAHPADASGGSPTPLLSASVVLTANQSGSGTVNYYVFGL
jgi:hypothetical protein